MLSKERLVRNAIKLKLPDGFEDRRAQQLVFRGDVRRSFRVTGEGGEPFTLLEAAKRELGDSNLALDLLQRGFIDENFTLYVADFHGAWQ